MKKAWLFGILLCAAAVLSGCGKEKILHCDRCGREVRVPADSDMTEDWIIMCADCEKEVYR